MADMGGYFRSAWNSASSFARDTATALSNGAKKIASAFTGDKKGAGSGRSAAGHRRKAAKKAFNTAKKKFKKQKKAGTPVQCCPPPPTAPTAAKLDMNSAPEDLLKDPRVKALLDVIAYSEGADYDTMVRGEGSRPITDFSGHPNVVVKVNKNLNSTAAGRYQFLYGTWHELGMPDFTPHSQDIAAIKLLKRRKMIEPLLSGDIEQSIRNGNREWASLPDSPYGQPTHPMKDLLKVYDSSLKAHGGS